MNPNQLQKQLKENAADLDEFYKDLENWRNKLTTKNQIDLKSAPVGGKCLHQKQDKHKVDKTSKLEIQHMKTKSTCTDYSSWDKFDADAECEKIDYNENDESELTDECDEALRDEAYVEKEKGNQHVKNKMWDKAIACYTKAINCFSYDPVFYANRGLCYLKKENYIGAEDDCTMSLKLDKTYVKAYQRRAAARKSLNKLEEAVEDLAEVLNLEPNNKESYQELKSLKKLFTPISQTKRLVSKFTASRNQGRPKNVVVPISGSDVGSSNSQIKRTDIVSDDNSGKRFVDTSSNSTETIVVKAVNKPVHLRSKKPLKRIRIQEQLEINKTAELLPKYEYPPTILNTDDLKIIEHQPIVSNMSKDKKNETNTNKSNLEHNIIYTPKSSVQFFSQWKHLQDLEHRYALLKLIEPDNLGQVFQESMESQVFSEILEVLAKCFVKNKDHTFSFLLNLSTMKRFSTLVMFMTDDDRNYLSMVFDNIRRNEFSSEEEITSLMRKYEL